MLLPALRARAILLLRCNDKAPEAPFPQKSLVRILCQCLGAGLFGEAHLDDSWFIIVFTTPSTSNSVHWSSHIVTTVAVIDEAARGLALGSQAEHVSPDKGRHQLPPVGKAERT